MPYRLTLILLTSTVLTSCGLFSSGKREWTYRYEPRKTAIIVNGKAVPPGGLPKQVMRAITAGNQIVGKPYKIGGGHGFLHKLDSGYDCSGTTTHVLRTAGVLDEDMTSANFRKYGSSGEGRYITVYARSGHVFLDVAGLRLDTGYHNENGPRWTTKSRPARGYRMRHPAGL
ncbi:MAG: peptidoglycan endopeptidase [Verrucomicrobiales bacterium]|nr:peptidoglycan endopeptidase [Verrucomicrobiales bacterium]MCP5558795.1 peptidoglycan endopeptidase [Verrucomicrobiaceae bacterium]